MLVGHGALAFFLVGNLVDRFTDRPPRQCLLLAFVALLFGTLPDVDALFALTRAVYLGIMPGTVAGFWEAVNTFHRSTTHSLFVQFAAGLVVVGTALLAPPRRRKTNLLGAVQASVATVGLVWTVTVYGSPLEGLLAIAFLTLAVLLGYVAVALTALTDRLVGVAALIGLLSHSPGDLFWIPPPDILYPFVSPTLSGPLRFSPVPEVNVALVFLSEALVVLLGTVTYFRIRSVSPLDRLYPSWFLGVLVLLFLPSVPLPTVENPYTYSAVLFGLALLSAGVVFVRSPAGQRVENSVLNAVGSVVVASLALVL